MSKSKTLLAITALAAVAAFSTLSASAQDQTASDAFTVLSGRYLAIQSALAADSLAEIPANAQALGKEAAELAAAFDARQAGVLEKDAETCRLLLPKIARTADALATAQDLNGAREAFAELSEIMVTYRNLVPGDSGPEVAYCPMAKHSWLQAGRTISNPYYGSLMLRCGTIVAR